ARQEIAGAAEQPEIAEPVLRRLVQQEQPRHQQVKRDRVQVANAQEARELEEQGHRQKQRQVEPGGGGGQNEQQEDGLLLKAVRPQWRLHHSTRPEVCTDGVAWEDPGIYQVYPAGLKKEIPE